MTAQQGAFALVNRRPNLSARGALLVLSALEHLRSDTRQRALMGGRRKIVPRDE